MERIKVNWDAIGRVEYPELQKEIKPDADARSIRLDVYTKDDKDRVFDIEMQMTVTKELPKRSRYYHSMLDLQLIDKGQTYAKLKPSFVIFICLADMFGAGRHKYTFETVCKKDNNIKLQDDTNNIALNTRGVIKELSDELIEFLKYVEHSNDKIAEESRGTHKFLYFKQK